MGIALLLVALSAALNLAGNRYGIGWLEEPDAESIEFASNIPGASLRDVWAALLLPSRYPHLLTYLMAPIFALVHGVDPYWIGRIVAGLLGALATGAVFRLGRAVHGARTGILAAAWFATSALVVQNGHLVKPHLPVVLFTTCALFHCVRMLSDPRRRHVVLAGAFGAAAAATVHSGFLVVVAIAVALAMRRSDGRVDRAFSPRRLLRADALLAFCLVLLAIPLAYPGRIPILFRVIFGHEHPAMLIFPHQPGGSVGVAGLARIPLGLVEYDPIVAVLGCAAIAVAIARIGRSPSWSRALAPGFAMLLAFVVVFGPDATFAIRFFLPVLPVLAVAAAALVVSLCERAPRPAATFAALTIVLCFPGAVTCARLDWLYRQEDTREAAARWIEANLPPNAPLVAHPYLDFPLPLVPASIEAHRSVVGSWTQFDQRQAAEIARGDPRPRFDVRFPFSGERVTAPAAFLAALRSSGARHAISIFHTGAQLSDPAFDVFRPLGTPVHVEAPGAAGPIGGEMYLLRWPFAQSWFVSRPGPLVEITRLAGGS